MSAIISNPAPPTIGTFDKWWVLNLALRGDTFTAYLQLWDGAHLLDKPTKVVVTDAGVAAAVRAQLALLFTATVITDMIIFASDPFRPIGIRATCDGVAKQKQNLFKLLAENPAMFVAYESVITLLSGVLNNG